MTRHSIVVLFGVSAALAACGKKKEAPTAEKAVAQPAGGSAAVEAPAAATGVKIGPIDLAAASVDLIALFPDATVELEPAEEGETVADTRELDTVAVRRGDKMLLEAELEAGTDRVVTIRVYDASIATPGGLDVGKPLADLAAKHPDVTCVEEKMSSSCGGGSAGTMWYELDAEHGTGGAFGEDVPVAKVPAGATIAQVHWFAGEGKPAPRLARRPPLAGASGAPGHGGDDGAGGDDGDHPAPRKPTVDEVDRCARVYAVVSACGVGHDFEFGWVKAKQQKLSAADAKKACDVPLDVDEDGMSAFPVPLLEGAALAKLEAAAKKSCKAVTDTLDEVSPGLGPAGYDPSE